MSSSSKGLYFTVIILYFIPTIAFSAKNEDLYRLVDKDAICDSLSIIVKVTAHSLSNCAMACRMKPECGMFSLDHVFSNETVSKKNVKLTCALCKSTNMTSVLEIKGWSTYMKWLKEIRFNLLETDNKASAPDITPTEVWNIDCNSPEVTDKRNGIIIGIWDDKDSFRDLDLVKCFNWDAAELFSEKPPRLLYIHLEDYRQCPKDYALTGQKSANLVEILCTPLGSITASNAAFRNVDNGKCTPLAPAFHIDYETCVTVNSEGKDGGSVDKWRPWRVQCPTAGPMVAVSLHRRRRIHTGLKCCVLKGLVPE